MTPTGMSVLWHLEPFIGRPRKMKNEPTKALSGNRKGFDNP